jgi:hypothetical protein
MVQFGTRRLDLRTGFDGAHHYVRLIDVDVHVCLRNGPWAVGYLPDADARIWMYADVWM